MTGTGISDHPTLAPMASTIRWTGSRWTLAGHVFRTAWRGALIWGVVFGLWVISTVKAFQTGYPTIDERRQLARSLQAFAMILGTPRNAETVAGFTSWRVTTVIAVIGATWALLSSTDLLRGEEDQGRWELLLAGPISKRWAVVQVLVGLGGTLAAMFTLTYLLILATGRMPGVHFSTVGSLLFALALVSGAAMFIAVGALASQIGASRGQAATVASIALGAAFVVRMVADSRVSLGWLRWFSPLGWVEELRPLEDPQPIALIPMAAVILVCAWLAVWIAGRRDLGASILREGGGGGNGRWLIGPTSLAVRLAQGSALAWLGTVMAMGAMFGSLERASASLLSRSPSITAVLGRLGVRQATQGYLGVVFLITDVFIAVMAASQINGIRGEEASGRLDSLLVRPVGRAYWLFGRLVVSVSLVLIAGMAAGLFTWLGARSQHTGERLPILFEAGLNAAVPGIFVLGAGVLVFGLRPRLSAAAVYGIVAWSFLVDLLGSLVKGNDWLRDSSLFTHVALAPAAKPDWGTAAIVVLLGVAAAVLGALAFQRRDVEYD